MQTHCTTAAWRALQKANPTIATHAWQLSQIRPELNGRAFRAGLLAAGGAVHRVGDDVYSVTSQDGGPICTVTLNGQGMRWATCTCADFVRGTHGNGCGAPRFRGTPRCQHILAVAMSPAYNATLGKVGGGAS
jgi:hypothetical protein